MDMAGLVSAGAARVLACDDAELDALEARSREFRECLERALRSTGDAHGSGEPALQELASLCRGDQREAFAERLGWDTITTASGSAEAVASTESAALLRTVLLSLADSAPPREAFSALLVSLHQALGSLPAWRSEDSSEGAGGTVDEHQAHGTPGASPRAAGSASLAAHAMLLGSLVRGLLTAFGRLRRRQRLFFTDALELLFCRVPAELSLLLLLSVKPEPCLDASLLWCLRRTGNAPRPVCKPPQPPSQSPSQPSSGAATPSGPHPAEKLIPAAEAQPSASTPAVDAHGKQRAGGVSPCDCAGPVRSPPGVPSEAGATGLGPAKRGPRKQGSFQGGTASAGRNGALEMEIGGTLQALLDLATLAANLPGISALAEADPALSGCEGAPQMVTSGESGVGEGAEGGEREAVVFRRLIVLALLQLSALATPLLALALCDAQQADTREGSTRPSPASGSSGELDARTSGTRHSGFGGVNAEDPAAQGSGSTREGSAFPLLPFLSTLNLLGVRPADLHSSMLWRDSWGVEAAAVLAGGGKDRDAEPGIGTEEGREGEGADSKRGGEEGWEERHEARMASVAEPCGWGAGTSLLCGLVCASSRWAYASRLPPGWGSPQGVVLSSEQQGLEPGDRGVGGDAEISQALPVLSLGAELLGEVPAAKAGTAAVADAIRAAQNHRAVLGLQLILLTQDALPMCASGRPGPIVATGAGTNTGTGTITGRGESFRADSEVGVILRRLVVRLCSPSSPQLEMLQRATYASLLCLLRKLLGPQERLAGVHALVKEFQHEPMLVSVLCSFLKEEVAGTEGGNRNAAATEVLPVLDTVLNPAHWSELSRSFPRNADALVGALNLYRFLVLQSLARQRSQGGASQETAEPFLERGHRKMAKEKWLLPIYNIARNVEAEAQEAPSGGHMGVPAMALSPTMVVLGIVSRCLELVDSV